eukprot:1160281-Pelagomonas_calceolata.AAC.8
MSVDAGMYLTHTYTHMHIHTYMQGQLQRPALVAEFLSGCSLGSAIKRRADFLNSDLVLIKVALDAARLYSWCVNVRLAAVRKLQKSMSVVILVCTRHTRAHDVEVMLASAMVS